MTDDIYWGRRINEQYVEVPLGNAYLKALLAGYGIEAMSSAKHGTYIFDGEYHAMFEYHGKPYHLVYHTNTSEPVTVRLYRDVQRIKYWTDKTAFMQWCIEHNTMPKYIEQKNTPGFWRVEWKTDGGRKHRASWFDPAEWDGYSE